jgi:hypothetical protein
MVELADARGANMLLGIYHGGLFSTYLSLDLNLELLSRPYSHDIKPLSPSHTVSLINITLAHHLVDLSCLGVQLLQTVLEEADGEAKRVAAVL